MECTFASLGTNGFHVMTDLLLRAPVVDRTSNMNNSRRRLADYVKTLHQKACCTIIFLHSTNQIIDLWRCCWCCRRKILKSLFCRGRHGIVLKSVPHVRHVSFFSFDQSNSALTILGSLRKHDGDGSENVIWKCNFEFLQSIFSYSKSLCLKNVF